jgi:hypothetical protein
VRTVPTASTASASAMKGAATGDANPPEMPRDQGLREKSRSATVEVKSGRRAQTWIVE